MPDREIRRSRRSARFAAVWGGALVLFAATGRTRETSRLIVALSYKVDPAIAGCPAEGEIKRAVVQPLGYDPFRNEALHQVTAQIQSSERGLEGQVLWTDAAGKREGERHLVSANRDCAELARGMTFAIAVQIQLLNSSAAKEAAIDRESAPSATEGSSSPAPAAAAPPGSSPSSASSAPPAAPGAPPAPATSSAPAAPPAPLPTMPLDVPSPGDKLSAGAKETAVRERFFAVGLGPRADVGLLSSASGGGRVFVGARSDAFSLELGVFANLPVTLRQDDGTGFSMNAFGATLAPCRHLRRASLCALGLIGRLRAEGFGVDVVRSPSSTFFKVGLRGAFDVPIGPRLSARIYADGLAMLTPRTVSLNDLAVWETPVRAGGGGLDLVVLFR